MDLTKSPHWLPCSYSTAGWQSPSENPFCDYSWSILSPYSSPRSNALCGTEEITKLWVSTFFSEKWS
jgi:hypothetical protein